MRDWVAARMLVTHPDECDDLLREASAVIFPRVSKVTIAKPNTEFSQHMWRLARSLKESAGDDPAKAAELEAAQAQHKEASKESQKARATHFLAELDS